jgi:hypothetical protein
MKTLFFSLSVLLAPALGAANPPVPPMIGEIVGPFSLDEDGGGGGSLGHELTHAATTGGAGVIAGFNALEATSGASDGCAIWHPPCNPPDEKKAEDDADKNAIVVTGHRHPRSPEVNLGASGVVTAMSGRPENVTVAGRTLSADEIERMRQAQAARDKGFTPEGRYDGSGLGNGAVGSALTAGGVQTAAGGVQTAAADVVSLINNELNKVLGDGDQPAPGSVAAANPVRTTPTTYEDVLNSRGGIAKLEKDAGGAIDRLRKVVGASDPLGAVPTAGSENVDRETCPAGGRDTLCVSR